MRITGLDHIVLLTSDVERSLDFYAGRLGLPVVREEEWRRGEVSFPSVRVSDATIIDLFHGDPTGINQHHFCLVVEDADITEVAALFEHVEGPVPLFGARGIGRSIYLQDPDGHIIELRTYPS